MSSLTRRESFRRAAILAGAGGLPFGCAPASETVPAAWQPVDPRPVTANGYGTDPNLIHPAPAPWPLTLTETQRELVGVLADILIPAEGDIPSATGAGVVDVLDEWVSAPYPLQQEHRAMLLSGLDWCDREAASRFGSAFAALTEMQQIEIVDDIAFPERASDAFAQPAAFFDSLRRLVTGMFYSSPEGAAELGYMGNVPISGEWPGPTDEAMAHLNEQLNKLGLEGEDRV